MVSPIDNSEILILGGETYNSKKLGDGWILNTDTLEANKVADTDLVFNNSGNACASIGNGKVVGLVGGRDLNFVTFKKADSSIKVISFGKI